MKPRLSVPFRCRHILALLIVLLIVATGLWPSPAWGATVHAQNDVNRSPFPSDRFTVADVSQNTRLRVNLPKPDCTVRRSDCEDIDVINTLDGFSTQPRLSIPFDGPINVQTVTSDTVFVQKLGDTLLPPIRQQGKVIGINRVLWDPATLTLFAEPDEQLEQHTRYALVVTRGVRDAEGNPVAAAPGFERVAVAGKEVAVTSVFTTQSVTAILEKIRDQIKATVPDRADFQLGPGGTRTVFAVDALRGISLSTQTAVNSPQFSTTPISLDFLNLVPGVVGRVAYGRYRAGEYLIHPGEFIPPVGTRTGTPKVQAINDVYFSLYLPSGRQPTAGWPVVIDLHGATGSKENGSVLNVIASLAARGIATIAITSVGHGGGPLGTLTVSTKGGDSVTFPVRGRGIDQNGDGVIAAREGDTAAVPRTIMSFSDGIRQTVADLMQLVRVIEMGIDVDGDGRTDLNPARIYAFGTSFGGAIAIVFMAVEPDVRAGAVTSAAGPIIENMRLSPINRPNIGTRLASRVPSLINTPGITSVGGISVAAPLFNENRPLKNQAPVINTVAGAIDIQAALDRWEWVPQPGNPLAYVRYLRKAPLDAMPAKSMLIHVPKGDQGIPNLNTSQMLLTGDLVDRSLYYRHDLAFAENPTLPKDSHAFTAGFRGGQTNIPAVVPIMLAAQEQVATFFESHGTLLIQPQPVRYFEWPMRLPLPDGLNYIP